MREVVRWLWPGGVALTLGMVVALSPVGSGSPGPAAEGAGWAIFGAGLFLGTFYHRSRVVGCTLGLALIALVGVRGIGGFTGLFFVGGILSLWAGAVSAFADRGILSRGGLVQLGSLIFLCFFSLLFLVIAPQDIAAFLSWTPLPLALTLWSGLPQPVFVAVLVGIGIPAWAAVVRGGAVERGLFWAGAAIGLALYLSATPGGSFALLAAGGAALGLSVVETGYAMAYSDELTGLPARRALSRDLAGITGPFTVAMVDVDHFKSFNDRYGHDVGDQVLRMVASRLKGVGGGGRAYRYGGEEFAVVFPGKDRRRSLAHLRKLRKEIEESVFLLRSWRRPRKKPVDPGAWKAPSARKPRRLSVTVSIGVADSTSGAPDPEAVLRRADQALYRAKDAGRNRVVY